MAAQSVLNAAAIGCAGLPYSVRTESRVVAKWSLKNIPLGDFVMLCADMVSLIAAVVWRALICVSLEAILGSGKNILLP